MEAVAYRGRMAPGGGYRPENHEWRDRLCDRDKDGRLVGKDPMTLSLDVLTASGHPQAKARDVVLRLRIMHGVDSGEARHDGFLGLSPEDFPKRLTHIRETVCVPCSSGNRAEVRRCPIYDYPAWAFRMGHNPHNPQRGIDRFAGKRPE